MFGPDFLDFEFQIKESGFILYSLESPTGSMVQKGNFDVLWMRKGTKDYLGIKRDILKVEGKEFDVLAHGKSEGLEGNIMMHCLQIQMFGNVNTTYKQRNRI